MSKRNSINTDQVLLEHNHKLKDCLKNYPKYNQNMQEKDNLTNPFSLKKIIFKRLSKISRGRNSEITLKNKINRRTLNLQF